MRHAYPQACVFLEYIGAQSFPVNELLTVQCPPVLIVPVKIAWMDVSVSILTISASTGGLQSAVANLRMVDPLQIDIVSKCIPVLRGYSHESLTKKSRNSHVFKLLYIMSVLLIVFYPEPVPVVS